MKMEMTKGLRKSVTKYGSILKAYRAQGGGGQGAAAGGYVLLIFGIFLGLLAMIGSVLAGMIVFLIFGGPGLLLILLGQSKHKKRMANYLEFYQQQTGYTLEELQEADRELMAPDAVMIGCATDRSSGTTEIVYIISKHYILSAWPVQGAYLRKIEDLVAAFYSGSIPGIGGCRQNLFLISRQETQKEGVKNPFDGGQYEGFENSLLTRQRHCREICNEVLDELMERAPGLITSQHIAVKGVKYNLLSMDNWKRDWAVILGE